MVMERMHGTPISQVGVLRQKGVDIPALARLRDALERLEKRIERLGTKAG
jgi:predicted unusual protein kinase regulating ubiquinone biosynthesis (AarF/ABC1/UbiB family)